MGVLFGEPHTSLGPPLCHTFGIRISVIDREDFNHLGGLRSGVKTVAEHDAKGSMTWRSHFHIHSCLISVPQSGGICSVCVLCDACHYFWKPSRPDCMAADLTVQGPVQNSGSLQKGTDRFMFCSHVSCGKRGTFCVLLTLAGCGIVCKVLRLQNYSLLRTETCSTTQ